MTSTTMSKTNWLNEQNNSSTLASRFLVFVYALHDYDVKPPDASSWFLSLFILNLDRVLKNSTAGDKFLF